MNLEEQLARIVELGWSPSLRLVADRWHVSAIKRGSGACVVADAETHLEAMADLIEKVEGWGK